MASARAACGRLKPAAGAHPLADAPLTACTTGLHLLHLPCCEVHTGRAVAKWKKEHARVKRNTKRPVWASRSLLFSAQFILSSPTHHQMLSKTYCLPPPCAPCLIRALTALPSLRAISRWPEEPSDPHKPTSRNRPCSQQYSPHDTSPCHSKLSISMATPLSS